MGSNRGPREPREAVLRALRVELARDEHERIEPHDEATERIDPAGEGSRLRVLNFQY